jgi:ribosomal protein L22
MTPDNPQDPQKGKVDEAAVPEEANDAKAEAAAEAPEAQPEPKPKRARKKAAPETEGQAAEETGVDKTAAEATEEKPKPRRTRAKAKEAEPVAEETSAPADESSAAAEEPAAEEPAKPARESSRRRGRRREPAEPGVLVRAQAKYVRTSARKARLVCDHIRGKDVAEARAILAFTPRAAAKPWLKLLESAIANAEHNHELVGDELRIAAVHADEGPTLKRYRPRAMGRATRIRKRTSHLTITLTPKES